MSFAFLVRGSLAAAVLLSQIAFSQTSNLPEAPQAQVSMTANPDNTSSALNTEDSGHSATAAPAIIVPRRQKPVCDENAPHSRACRFQWGRALAETSEFLSIVHLGNLSEYGYEIHGSFFKGWFK